MKKENYIVEITDTFAGEANYSWIKRYLVSASSFRGAITKVSKQFGGGWRNKYIGTDSAEYRMPSACIVAFVTWMDEVESANYANEYSCKKI